MSAKNVPIENNDIRHRAAGNLAFLLSVIRCGESLSPDEEASVRSLIDGLEAAQLDQSEPASKPQPVETDFSRRFIPGDAPIRQPGAKAQTMEEWEKSLSEPQPAGEEK